MIRRQEREFKRRSLDKNFEPGSLVNRISMLDQETYLGPSVGERPPEKGKYHERNILAMIRDAITRSYFELSTLLTQIKTVNEMIVFSHW